MRYLLDTHVLLWYRLEPGKLSREHHRIIGSRTHPKYVSTISIWEISLKFSLGKLKLGDHTPEEFIDGARAIGFRFLAPKAEDFATFHRLPASLQHKDPFDRMLVWQAIRQNLALLSHDSKMPTYKIHGLELG